MSGGLVPVGKLTANDSDQQDSITGYEIQQVGADHSFFKLTLSPDGATADLSLQHVPNFEGQETYTITVRTTSGAGIREESNSEEVTIAVTDADEPPGTPDAPTISHPSRGTSGPPGTRRSTSDRTSTTTTSSTVRRTRGNGRTGATPGRGTPPTLGELERDTIYEVKVKAHNDEGESDWSEPGEGSTRANIPPVLAGVDISMTRSVPENSPAGTPVGDPVSATDEDIDDEGRLQYSLQGADAAAFDINQDTGQIQVREPLNHEDKDSYQVTVKVIDNQTGSDTVEVNIAITDLPEKPNSPAAPTVEEGQHANTLDVTWTEPGSTGPAISNYHIQYRKSSDTAWERWPQLPSADTDTTIAGLLTDTEYQVQVRAYNNELWSDWSDSGEGRTADNSSPVFDDGATTERAVTETPGDQAEATGREVGAAVTATDQDTGDTVIYSLEGSDAVHFDIDTATGQIRTKAGTRYDHEAKETYNVEVLARDGRSMDQGHAAIQVTVTIEDIDEPPVKMDTPTFTGTSRHQTTVSWTAPSNTGRPDIDNYRVRYDSSPASTERTLEDTSLGLQVTGLDDGVTYWFQVQAHNAEGWGAWSEPGEATTPANRIPIFQEGSSAARSLPENSQAGMDVGTALTATDEDNDTLTYSIDGENDGEFTIDHQTGRLQSGNHSYDHEATRSHTLTVAVNDGEGGQATITVTVNITDVEEPPDTPQAPGVTAVSSTSLKASWTAPDNQGRPPIDGYMVQHRIDQNNSNWEDSGHSGPAIQATITGLEPGTTYRYRSRRSTTRDSADGLSRAPAPPNPTSTRSSSRGPPRPAPSRRTPAPA